jgi:hypothetical protein
MSQNGNTEKDTKDSGNSSSNDEEQSHAKHQELVPVSRYELVVTNPIVAALSKAFHWKPSTAVARIERALPDKFEQQVYLGVAESFRIHPESLAKLLSLYRGAKPLSVNDLDRRSVGKNVVANSFGDFSDFFEACMALIKVVSKEFAAFNLSMELAARIVLAYGPNNPEQVIEMIDTNLDECSEFFEISTSRPYGERMRMCTWFFITDILPELQRRGVPNPLDTSEFIGDLAWQTYCLGEELSVDREDPELEKRIRELVRGDIDEY